MVYRFRYPKGDIGIYFGGRFIVKGIIDYVGAV